MSCKSVPVTIISGSLGAGKTTLMKRILTEKHGLRIAVIENEFADSMGIESLILKNEVEGAVAEGYFELSNGCICCSVKDSLLTTLQTIMQVKEKFDYILVETSGMASPGPVAATFWTDLDDDCPIYLDGIVAIVDALSFQAVREVRGAAPALDAAEAELSAPTDEEGEEAAAAAAPRGSILDEQVACADVVLLNKLDKASAEERAQCRAIITGLNPIARLIETSFAAVDLRAILSLGAYSLHAAAPEKLQAFLEVPKEGQEEGGAAGAAPAEGSASAATAATSSGDTQATRDGTVPLQHDQGISHCSIVLSAPVLLESVKAWLGLLLYEQTVQGLEEEEEEREEGQMIKDGVQGQAERIPLHILRCKGLLWAAGDEEEEPQEKEKEKQTALSAVAASEPTILQPPLPAAYILQAVGQLFELEPVTPSALRSYLDSSRSAAGAAATAHASAGAAAGAGTAQANCCSCSTEEHDHQDSHKHNQHSHLHDRSSEESQCPTSSLVSSAAHSPPSLHSMPLLSKLVFIGYGVKEREKQLRDSFLRFCCKQVEG